MLRNKDSSVEYRQEPEIVQLLQSMQYTQKIVLMIFSSIHVNSTIVPKGTFLHS